MVLPGWPVAPGPPHVAIPVSAEHDLAPALFPGTAHKLSVLDSDLTTRKETRQKAWEVDGWAETVSKVRSLVIHDARRA